MIPIKKSYEGLDVPSIAVDTNQEDNVPRKKILSEGGPAPEPITVTALNVTENGTYPAPEGSAYSPVTVNVSDVPAVIESLSITANGTYTAPSGVDGYSPITVNVPAVMPEKTIISNFDFTSNTPYFDTARQIDSTTWFAGLTLDAGVGLRITSYTTQSRTPTYLNYGQYYHIELGIGNLDQDSYAANTYNTNALFGMMLNSGAIELFFEKDVSKWGIKSTASKVYLDDTIYNTPTHFDGKKIDIYYGCYLNNGVLTKHDNYCHVYFEGAELGNAQIVGNTNDYIPNCRLGGRKYPIYAMIGARFTSLKTEQFYNLV